MKEHIEQSPILLNLLTFCNGKIIPSQPTASTAETKRSSVSPLKTKLTEEQQTLQDNHAAKLIQRFWRDNKLKSLWTKDPYNTYLSLFDPGDKALPLSAIMFGLHVAELSSRSKDVTKNPFRSYRAAYHRLNQINGAMIIGILSTFNISTSHASAYTFVPISLPLFEKIRRLPSLPPILQKSLDNESISLIQKSDSNIALIAIPKTHQHSNLIRIILSGIGVVASLWQIAENIKDVSFPNKKHAQIKLDHKLPSSKAALLQSNIMGRLNLVASSQRHPTQNLAICLRKLLNKLPPLDEKSIQRIAFILDLTHTFHAHHYTQYAFCIYTILHEIGLFFSQNRDPALLQKLYQEFDKEAKTTLLHVLGLEGSELSKSEFVALPALSGTNAYALAKLLASKIQTKSGKPPTIKVIRPCYYEFGFIEKDLTQTDGIDPDVFVICAGPIVEPTGLRPGIDINRFVRRHIIGKHCTKPVTIIVDATTSLYKNLKLDDDVQTLVESGQLSIIIHESHQKFGLLHTDQAQYGRTFGICSKRSYTTSDIADISVNSSIDFLDHTDMQIGAFINVACEESLEAIKTQHFRNGASLGWKEVHPHEDMLTNPDEYYFSCSPQPEMLRMSELLVSRDSFGHYATSACRVTAQIRFSPDASDNIDFLIQSVQLSLFLEYSVDDLDRIIVEHTQAKESLPFGHQVICLAMLNNFLHELPLKLEIEKEVLQNIEKHKQTIFSYQHVKDSLDAHSPTFNKLLIDRFAAMNALLLQCQLLRGRQSYLKIDKYLLELQGIIIEQIHPVNAGYFFRAVNTFYENKVQLSERMISHLAAEPLLCIKVIQNEAGWEKLSFVKHPVLSLVDTTSHVATSPGSKGLVPHIGSAHNFFVPITSAPLHNHDKFGMTLPSIQRC